MRSAGTIHSFAVQSISSFLANSTSLVRDAVRIRNSKASLALSLLPPACKALDERWHFRKRHCTRDGLLPPFCRGKPPATHLRQDCPRRRKPEALGPVHHRPDSLLDPACCLGLGQPEIGDSTRKMSGVVYSVDAAARPSTGIHYCLRVFDPLLGVLGILPTHLALGMNQLGRVLKRRDEPLCLCPQLLWIAPFAARSFDTLVLFRVPLRSDTSVALPSPKSRRRPLTTMRKEPTSSTRGIDYQIQTIAIGKASRTLRLASPWSALNALTGCLPVAFIVHTHTLPHIL